MSDELTPDEIRQRIEDLSREPEPEPEPEVEPEVLPELASGAIKLSYSNALIKRDEAGRITEVVGEGWRKLVRRDEFGRIAEIYEEREVEE